MAEINSKHVILVVEDDADVPKVLIELIGDLADVTVATTVEGAKSQLEQTQWSLVILDAATSDGKTAALAKQVKNLGWKRALIIDGASVDEAFASAARNITGLDILPTAGANVYDILKRDTLVITKAGVEALEARFK